MCGVMRTCIVNTDNVKRQYRYSSNITIHTFSENKVTIFNISVYMVTLTRLEYLVKPFKASHLHYDHNLSD